MVEMTLSQLFAVNNENIINVNFIEQVVMNRTHQNDSSNKAGYWSAVFSMTLCVAMLIASEFMPVSLLTPIADGLDATKGQAGQAISVSGFFAVVASLLTSTVAGKLNRKWVLLAMTGCMLLSLVFIALAPDFIMLMVARALLGICVGGFWSLATAVIMRLVPADSVSKALAIMYSGQAVAAAFAAPLGSYLGDLIGWRGVFWVLVPVVAVNLIWQMISLPSMPTDKKQGFGEMFGLLKRGYFARGIIASICVYAGAFAMFTYLRPYIESEVKGDVLLLTFLLLLLGVAGFAGTWLGGKFANDHAVRFLQGVPLVMSVVTAGLIGLSGSVFMVGVLLALWGICNTAMSIGWMTWLSQNVDDAPEAAGSIIVAAIQAAILFGAAAGGVLLDSFGINVTFAGSVVLTLVSLCLVGSGRGVLKPQTE